MSQKYVYNIKDESCENITIYNCEDQDKTEVKIFDDEDECLETCHVKDGKNLAWISNLSNIQYPTSVPNYFHYSLGLISVNFIII
ncbi:hypothetical protein Avbf_19051 [Armadillidium vulgare]|nr:hypothetical protein Avbf_19051 [Armadillidium vulgare]